MRTVATLLVLLSLFSLACQMNRQGTHSRSGHPISIEECRAKAAARGLILDVPDFERSPEEVVASVDAAIAGADQRLDRFAAQDLNSVSFESTFVALDHITYPVINLLDRLWLMKETQVDAAMREATSDQVDRLNEWVVALQYREDIYRVCKAYEEAYQANSSRNGRLVGEELKLMEETMRDYRRAGLHLDAATREQVEALMNRRNELSSDFDSNISNAAVTVHFTAEQLPGVPEDFLSTSRQADGRHAVRATVITDYLAVMENCGSEETRKRLKTARYAVAMEENLPILDELLRLRDQIASLLGYPSWAAYQIEPRMAEQPERAMSFAEDLVRGLDPKFDAEVEEFRRLKVADTGDPNARIEIWDFRYYIKQLQKQRYNVDANELKEFFELGRVQAGMFAVYEEIFGLEFTEVEAPHVWAEGVQLYLASDSETGEPLGLFYLDLFPREGKYNHFAQFDIIEGKQLANGQYQRPVVALVCNFPAPSAERPSLLSHSDVETYFHEFGHALHAILTKARFVRFSGTRVPRDFVEAPSQMLEAWAWDPTVLGRFAVHYRDENRKLDPDLLERLKEADLATKGVFYRRQLCFALSDLRMHQAGSDKQGGSIANQTMAEVFFAPPEGTAFAAYWGHLTGYDAGYYGYAWADSIAADLATTFEQAPDRFLDREVGMRLRREIYEPGGSRPVEESIRRFLGRERDSAAFLSALGIQQQP